MAMIGLDQSRFTHKLKPPFLWVETKQNKFFLIRKKREIDIEWTTRMSAIHHIRKMGKPHTPVLHKRRKANGK